MRLSKFVYLDPAASQRKLNHYFQQFHRIRNYIGISKGYWLKHRLCEIVPWPLMSSQEDTAVTQLHFAYD